MSELKIDVRVTQSDRKSMKLSVSADGTVLVEAPKAMSKKQITALIDQKKSWIISKVKQRNAAGTLYNNLLGTDAEKISYLGRECRLKLEETEAKKAWVKLKNGALIVYSNDHSPETVKSLVEMWFREKTKEEVEFWIKCYQPQFDQVPNRVVIKEQKKRWGSCSNKHNLNFNWRLSMMPTWVIAYIVLHELCHFEELNHSAAFWQSVEKRMPEYDKANQWLKENGHRFLPE